MRTRKRGHWKRYRFNEAPIHESGKFPARVAATGPVAGFNEAPIHESGKFDSAESDKVSALGFNEAPIHESGKSVQNNNQQNRQNVLQ